MAKALFLLACVVVTAGAGGFAHICNCAPAPNGTVLVHADIAQFGSAEIASRLFYSTDGQATWSEQAMTRLGAPGYDSTWQGGFPLPGSGAVWYYVQADQGEYRASQSPRNTGDAWPPPDNLIAQAGVDPAGDAFNNPEGNWLDLTGLWLGYSNDYFYFMLTNNGNSWPTSGGLLKWYSYSVGFVNPEAPSDSWIFAPVYVDAWPVMQQGLYAINRYSRAIPTRIADIEYQTSGNRLYLRCRIADMTGDARFGPWPNSSGWLTCAANTQTITTSGATLKDTTTGNMYYAGRTQQRNVGHNTEPRLGIHGVEPDSGGGSTGFYFFVTYTDSDTNLPVARDVIVDSDTIQLAPSGHDYARGASFNTRRGDFNPGWHSYRFRFDDGMSTVTTTPDSFFVYGVGIDGEPSPSIQRRVPSVVRGSLILNLTSAFCNLQSDYVLLDISGRRVLALHPGPNDVSHLSPGVYFVHSTIDIRQPTVFRVVVLR